MRRTIVWCEAGDGVGGRGEQAWPGSPVSVSNPVNPYMCTRNN